MTMPLEDMVRILLALESNLDFHIEALKAHAVALRTNIYRGERKIIEIDNEYSLENDINTKS